VARMQIMVRPWKNRQAHRSKGWRRCGVDCAASIQFRGSDAACECAVYGANLYEESRSWSTAIRIHQHGGRSDEVEEVDVGEPGRAGAPEARAVGLNYIDTYHRSGLYISACRQCSAPRALVRSRPSGPASRISRLG